MGELTSFIKLYPRIQLSNSPGWCTRAGVEPRRAQGPVGSGKAKVCICEMGVLAPALPLGNMRGYGCGNDGHACRFLRGRGWELFASGSV